MRGRRLKGSVLILLCMNLVGDSSALVLARLGSPLRPPIAAAGAGEGTLPVVLVAGFMSEGAGFAHLAAALRAEGTPVLDFDPARPGTQPLTYRPSSAHEHIPELAARVVQPAIEDALAQSGYDPTHQHVDVVAHSAGGLLVRSLIEAPAAGVDRDWAARIDDLVMMVATPNHGSAFGSWLATVGRPTPWDGVAGDFRPGSEFLRRLGTAEPPGEVYTAIGGEALALNWLRSDDDGDGRAHGHDGVVPAESPFVTGAALAIEPRTHGKLLPDARVIRRIIATLRAPSAS